MNSETINANWSLRGVIQTPSLDLVWSELPWDTALFGHPVLQIGKMAILGPNARADFAEFEKARDYARSGLVSCRLPIARLKESMLLEDAGFRFIEMIYSPELTDLDSCSTTHDPDLTVSLVAHGDLPAVMEIAGKAFSNERFHADPRLPSHLADQRYRNWVSSSLAHTSQRLYVLRENKRIIAFFVTELLADDSTCYWHLINSFINYRTCAIVGP